MNPAIFRTDIPITLQENFINEVYSSADKAVADELDRLRIEETIIPSCTMGCCHCCQYHIITTTEETQAMVLYIKRNFSENQIEDIRARTEQWHAWDDSRPGRHPTPHINAQADFSNYVHRCPLLADDICSVYPVRPIVCRTHYVRSLPLLCRAANDPTITENPPVVLTSVVTATRLFSQAIRDNIKDTDGSVSQATMLLPQLLAITMGWNCAISF